MAGVGGVGGVGVLDCCFIVFSVVGRTIVSYTYWPEGEERLWRDSLEMVGLRED